MKKYDPKKIEAKWQKFWEAKKTFEVTEGSAKPKFYGLIEFPYPSAEGLHVGHPRPFTAMDVISRKRRMQGYNVLFPIGFDAFGLPTENFAIKTGQPPAEVTQKNIANFTRQLKALGYSFDWDRQVNTSDPAYYKWTQWIFLQLFKHGLAYKKNQPINWCPKDKIGLANEEVVAGCCERCGTAVEKRNKEQWMLAITKYADKLLEGLKEVDYITPARVQQENWIGESDGALVKFQISNFKFQINSKAQNSNGDGLGSLSSAEERVGGEVSLEVFTTRPDTLFGVTFLAISAELAKKWLSDGWQTSDKVKKYVGEIIDEQKITDREEKEKTGVDSGVKAINPANNEEIPVWITNYVMGDVGTGAIMAVPAHDERDWEFAKKYGLAIKQVVAPYIIHVGTEAPRSDKNIVKFNAASAIIKHWEKDLFYVVHFSDFLQGFIGGHVEPGETTIETARREATEESGYTDVKEIKPFIDHAFGRGYKTRKSREEECHDSLFIVQLGSGARTEIIDKETKNGSWMNADEILRSPTFSNTHRLFFEHYIKNKPFTGTGRMVNSGKYDGLTSEETKKKIIEFVGGKRQVNYKLRDWVFSRQRYWGEPIPLVYCENCKNKKYKYVFVHGYTATGDKNGTAAGETDSWRLKLRLDLEKSGNAVYSPDLPNTNEPNIDEQVDFILNNTAIDNNTILIGHSLGGIVILKLLEKLNKKVAKVLFVDPMVRPQFPDRPRPMVVKSNDWKFNFEKIKKLSDEFVILGDVNFKTIFEKDLKDLTNSLDGILVLVNPEDRHFTSDKEPAINKLLEQNGWIPLSEDQLPLKLPKVEKYQPTDTGESPLAAMTDWVNTKCPRCGGAAKRETDTMPNWAGSSWYFLRYCDPDNDKAFASPEKLKYWTPVDWYNGGMEHTVLHLLYSRFWNQFLYDIGVVPTREPYKKRTSHGMILGPDGEKMSKSRGNVINPDEMIEKFGTDAFRGYIMFMGPFDQAVMWDTNGLVGVRRFLDKVWALQEKVVSEGSPNFQFPISNFQSKLHQTIKKVSDDIEAMRFNTAIAKLMELVNEMSRQEKLLSTHYSLLIQLLSPFAPHIAEELWEKFGNGEPLAFSAWPKYDPALAKEETVTIAVQVNGKVRDELTADAEIGEEEIKKLTLASAKVQKWLEGKMPKKIIYVKGKLISIVV